jgi:hypothetical protein
LAGHRHAKRAGLLITVLIAAFAYDDAMRKVPEPLLVSLDFGKLTFN